MQFKRLILAALGMSWFVYLAVLMYQIACIDSITSVANDSVNYLAMAQYYSPWFGQSEAIQSVWARQDFPPLFPLILAITSLSHHLLGAHVLVILFGLVSLPLLYLWINSHLRSPAHSLLIILAFSMSPGYIIGLQGILSESLYLLISLVLFLQLNSKGKYRLVILSILLVLILMTRTVGIAMAIAMVCHSLVAMYSRSDQTVNYLLPVMLSLVIYKLLDIVIGPESSSHYASELGYLFSMSAGGIIEQLLLQLKSIVDSWQTFWLIYWNYEYDLRYLLVASILVAGIFGLVYRLRQNQVDAWYVLTYLLILIIWPHPGQMVRLLFPIVPFILFYSIYLLAVLLVRTKTHETLKERLPVFFAALLLAFVSPSHAFIHGRIDMATNSNMVPVYEIFRRPAYDDAMNELVSQNLMLNGFMELKDWVNADDTLLYYVPEYVAVLGGRKGIHVKDPQDIIDHANTEGGGGARYVLMTKIHPRKSRPGYSGFMGLGSLKDVLQDYYCYQSEDSGMPVFCVYTIKPR